MLNYYCREAALCFTLFSQRGEINKLIKCMFVVNFHNLDVAHRSS